MRPLNYIVDQNLFSLAGPPDHFLRQLWDFDDSLVIVPSRQGFYYRLAQKRPMKLSVDIVNDTLFKESDTKMLAQYGLVPVTTILATANWSNPLLLEELRRRAPWRLGGAAAVNAMLEDQDKKDEIDRKVRQDDMLTCLTKDAWGLYNKKIGTRSHMWSPTVKKSRAASLMPSITAQTAPKPKTGILLA